MIDLFNKALNTIRLTFQKLELKRFLAITLVGFVVLATSLNSNIESGYSKDSVTRKLDKIVNQDDTDRPQTMREWKQEARETENDPLERAKRIVNQSGEALQEWGSVYPDTAKRSVEDFQNIDK